MVPGLSPTLRSPGSHVECGDRATSRLKGSGKAQLPGRWEGEDGESRARAEEVLEPEEQVP